MVSNDYRGGNHRAFVVSRSAAITQANLDSNVNTAGRWLENFSTIQDMSNSVTEIMQQNIYGVTFSGANICGYHWNTTPELCARWYKIGAFYPLAINLNHRDNSVSQAPYDFSSDIKDEIQDAMATRYSLLRYMNTNLFHHSLWSDEEDAGGTFFKPVFFEFPEEEGAYDYMSLNAMLGSSIKLSLQSDTVYHGRNWNFYSPVGVWCDIFNLTLGIETCHNITT